MQMKMPDKLTGKQLRRLLTDENDFITKLLEVSQVPDSVERKCFQKPLCKYVIIIKIEYP